MPISQKTQYAVRAVFELAKRRGTGATKISDIAEAQAIPQRFLENILNQLKGGGFVESVRGKDGGYLLVREPKDVTVGEILRFIEGPFSPVECRVGGKKKDSCPMAGRCPFRSLWDKAEQALAQVYNGTTFGELVIEEAEEARAGTLDFSI
ncbi:MAG: Rrf2 family transcriptional regulator [Deltaproteobacteria bacterium]|nr:Rrf2 family transcriptional regulator [Deltaproteobacteria bacterium]